MVDLRIGVHGLIILLVVFLLLGLEDILIWINSGVIPGVEFLIATFIVVIVFALAIREANVRSPRRR